MSRIHVIVPDDVLEEVDGVSGQRGRSEVITDALKRYLAWRKQEEALRHGAGAWSAERHPEFPSNESIDAWVRRERVGWDRRVAEERGDYEGGRQE